MRSVRFTDLGPVTHEIFSKHDRRRAEHEINPRKKNGEHSVNLLGYGAVVLMVPGDVAHHKKGPTPMNTPSIETSEAELAVIKGFEGEDIEVSVEQLDLRIMPESLAGFLE